MTHDECFIKTVSDQNEDMASSCKRARDEVEAGSDHEDDAPVTQEDVRALNKRVRDMQREACKLVDSQRREYWRSLSTQVLGEGASEGDWTVEERASLAAALDGVDVGEALQVFGYGKPQKSTGLLPYRGLSGEYEALAAKDLEDPTRLAHVLPVDAFNFLYLTWVMFPRARGVPAAATTN